MSADPRQVERVLARCIRKAKRAGLHIIYNAKQTEHGVCAMGAYERLGEKGPKLALPRNGDRLCDAYDAIEAGFDGCEGGVVPGTARAYPTRWLDVGLRLRAKFKPVDAQELEEREAERIRQRIRFTEGDE